MIAKDLKDELIKKYRLAGMIRFISFSLLLSFLLLLKFIGGYAQINAAFLAFIFIEAVLNQPYPFILKKVDILRFQYYQMLTDIVSISWIIYYMGGIDAPIISIAYYAVILWAGFASTTHAVLFAVIASSFFFSLIVAFEYSGILPPTSQYGYRMPASQLISLLIGNIAFLFAFGYFSAHSSAVIGFLQRKRQEDALRNTHKLTLTGYLVCNTAHDLLNNLTNAEGYTQILLEQAGDDGARRDMLKTIEKMQQKSIDLVKRLGKFSKESGHDLRPTNINKAIDDALDLANPILRYSNVEIEKVFDPHLPFINTGGDDLQEVFLAFILNSIDAVPKQGKLTISTEYMEKDEVVKIVFKDTGVGFKQEDLKRAGEVFFTTKNAGEGLGLGLAMVYGIINQYKGSISVESSIGKGATFTIQLPVIP